MQSFNLGPRKKSKFLNFVYQANGNPSNDIRAASYVESLNANIYSQSALGSTTTINLRSSKEIRYLPESIKMFVPGDSPSAFEQITDNRNCETKVTKNHCEGDTKADFEPLLTQEDLASLPFDRTFNVVNFLKQEESNHNIDYEDKLNFQNLLLSGSALTKAYLEKNLNKLKRSATEVKTSGLSFQSFNNKPKNVLRSQSYIEKMSFLHSDQDEVVELQDKALHADIPLANPLDKTNIEATHCRVCENTQTEMKTKSFSFMSPTISSECKNQRLEIKNIESLISPTRKVRSMSPKPARLSRLNASMSEKIDSSFVDVEKAETDQKIDNKNSCADLGSLVTSTTSSEAALVQAIIKLREADWNTALRGLAEIVELCKTLEPDLILPHMTLIDQRIIDLIKSPRSHVSRTSCQAVGHIFEFVKDTRRPEFDELVDILLCKCADSNRFIRHDANLALDCMVTHIPTFHAVRAICAKGPEHKNPLVRTAAARILVCAMVLAGPQNVTHPSSNEYTRRRLIMKMAGFLEDRNPDVRKYGERIYKMLSKDKIFDLYLNRYLEKDVIKKMRKIMKDTRVV